MYIYIYISNGWCLGIPTRAQLEEQEKLWKEQFEQMLQDRKKWSESWKIRHDVDKDKIRELTERWQDMQKKYSSQTSAFLEQKNLHSLKERGLLELKVAFKWRDVVFKNFIYIYFLINYYVEIIRHFASILASFKRWEKGTQKLVCCHLIDTKHGPCAYMLLQVKNEKTIQGLQDELSNVEKTIEVRFLECFSRWCFPFHPCINCGETAEKFWIHTQNCFLLSFMLDSFPWW